MSLVAFELEEIESPLEGRELDDCFGEGVPNAGVESPLASQEVRQAQTREPSKRLREPRADPPEPRITFAATRSRRVRGLVQREPIRDQRLGDPVVLLRACAHLERTVMTVPGSHRHHLRHSRRHLCSGCGASEPIGESDEPCVANPMAVPTFGGRGMPLIESRYRLLFKRRGDQVPPPLLPPEEPPVVPVPPVPPLVPVLVPEAPPEAPPVVELPPVVPPPPIPLPPVPPSLGVVIPPDGVPPPVDVPPVPWVLVPLVPPDPPVPCWPLHAGKNTATGVASASTASFLLSEFMRPLPWGCEGCPGGGSLGSREK